MAACSRAGAGLLLLAGWIIAFAVNTTIGVGVAWVAVAALTGGVAIAHRKTPRAGALKRA